MGARLRDFCFFAVVDDRECDGCGWVDIGCNGCTMRDARHFIGVYRAGVLVLVHGIGWLGMDTWVAGWLDCKMRRP